MTNIKQQNRRDFIRNIAAGSAGAIAFSGLSYGKNNGEQMTPLKDYSKRARKIVKSCSVVDMLGFYQEEYKKIDGKELSEHWIDKAGSFTKKDFEKIRSSGIQVFAAANVLQTYERALSYYARENSFIASNSQYFERLDTPEKLKKIQKSKKIGIILSNQNSSHFRKIEDIDFFYSLGQRVSQITYNGENELGYGSFVDEDNGLKPYGKKVVKRMNEIGMAVDLSHCGDKTTLDAIEVSTKPVLITHAACRALNPGYARAKTDEMIKKMAATGGVIGIPMLRFMVRDKEPVTKEHFFKHINHVVNLVGINHVGIGSDMSLNTEDMAPFSVRKRTLQGAPPKYKTHSNKDFLISIEELNHPKRTFDVAEGLLKRGYSDKDIKKVLGNNFLRVLSEIW